MKVFYAATDQHKLSDPSFKFHAEEDHPDLKGKKVRSTAYIGSAENIIFKGAPALTRETLENACKVLSAPPAPLPEIPPSEPIPTGAPEDSTEEADEEDAETTSEPTQAPAKSTAKKKPKKKKKSPAKPTTPAETTNE